MPYFSFSIRRIIAAEANASSPRENFPLRPRRASLRKTCWTANRPRRAKRAIQELNLGQAEEIRRVLHGHLAHLVSGHAPEVVLQHLMRFWPVGFLVREVVRPDQAIDVQVMTVVDARAVALEPPIEIFIDQLAGLAGKRLDTVVALGPADVAVIACVGHLHEVRNPADRVLGKEDAEFRKALEHA